MPSPVQKLTLAFFASNYAVSIIVLSGGNDLLSESRLLDDLLSNSVHFRFLSITTQLPCISCVRNSIA